MIDTKAIINDLQSIERRYNGDNDMIPGGPDVTWAEMKLAGNLIRLADKVQDLQNQINEINHDSK